MAPSCFSREHCEVGVIPATGCHTAPMGREYPGWEMPDWVPCTGRALPTEQLRAAPSHSSTPRAAPDRGSSQDSTHWHSTRHPAPPRGLWLLHKLWGVGDAVHPEGTCSPSAPPAPLGSAPVAPSWVRDSCSPWDLSVQAASKSALCISGAQ